MNDIRYPIGPFVSPETITAVDREKWIVEVAHIPLWLSEAVNGLSDEQLDTPYREGGWTVRQVVHHLADAHLNHYMRLKLGLTEENPTIKDYDNEEWAELIDARTAPIVPSLRIVEAIHERMVVQLNSMEESDFNRTVYRSGKKETVSLGELLAKCAWHGKHHIAHITSFRKRKGW